MNEATTKVSAVVTLFSLVLSVITATVLWTILSKASGNSNFLMIGRDIWVIGHVTSSVTLVTSFVFYLVVNWRRVKKFIFPASSAKSKTSNSSPKLGTELK